MLLVGSFDSQSHGQGAAHRWLKTDELDRLRYEINRIPHHHFDLVVGFAINLVECQPLELGSRGGLHLAEG